MTIVERWLKQVEEEKLQNVYKKCGFMHLALFNRV